MCGTGRRGHSRPVVGLYENVVGYEESSDGVM